MRKTVVITQSNYLPWKGYFDLINTADEFHLFDEVQYTRRDWRNRNKVVVDGTVKWLTIPVKTKGHYNSPIAEMEVVDKTWTEKHWNTIHHAYGRTPYFAEYGPHLEDTYAAAARLTLLSDINRLFLERLAGILDIHTPVLDAAEVPRTTDDPTGRLVEICVARGADRYVSGPAARAYIQEDLFEAAGVELCYADYGGYPDYPQELPKTEHGVSVIDLLMREGPTARDHLKSVRTPERFAPSLPVRLGNDV